VQSGQRLREKAEMRAMLSGPVERFIGLGLKLHEARRK
jgi:hypothetical protein